MNYGEKEQYRASAGSKLNLANSLLLAEYRGLTVSELSSLRIQLRKNKASFVVCKNRIMKKAIDLDSVRYKEFGKCFVGPSALVYVEGDISETAKVLFDFEKDHPNLKIKSGFVDGCVVDAKQLKEISDLPSKEVLLGRILASLQAPHRELLGVLKAGARDLVYAISAIRDKKTS